MSLNIKGSTCSRCKAYLFEEDDIVYCPVCGAPHHRECYNALGHCALEELHGTENEYKREEPKIEDEPKVETNENSQNNFYSYSPFGANLQNASFQMFDFLGGVPSDYKFDENVTATDAKKFVLTNTHRYIPKFASLNKKKKASWNWLAFLCPAPWFFSRKMYKSGIISGFLSIISTILSFPLYNKLNAFGIYNSTSYPEMIKNMTEIIPSLSKEIMLISFISVVINLALMFISGIFADYWYKKHTISSIKKIKAESADIEQSYRKKGGVNIFWFYLCYMALQVIPNLILTLI